MPPIELKPLENGLGGWDRPDFGTVRPRVQIPDPRPTELHRATRARDHV